MKSNKRKFRKGEVWGRFEVEPSYEGWNMIDNFDCCVVEVETKREALEIAAFAREYVRRHGDIDVNSFPYTLDALLHYHRDTVRVWL